MTKSHMQTKTWQQSAIRPAMMLAGLGLAVALASAPALASDHDGEEAHEQHGAGTSESRFYGVVQKMPPDRIGSWTVDGREIKVTSATRIKEKYGKAVTGAYVKIRGSNTGKIFTADKIEVKRAKQ